MDNVNVRSLGGRLISALHCDRLYDVLLAKAYRRDYPRQGQTSLQQEEYPVILTVECNSRGLVTDVRMLEQADPGPRY